MKDIQRADARVTEIAICGSEREREDHDPITMRSRFLSVKQKAILRKWLEISNLGIVGTVCFSNLTIDEIVRHLPLSYADVAQIKWSDGPLSEIVARSLLKSLRRFFEDNDLTHLFPMATSPIEGDILVKDGAKNRSKIVDIFVDIRESHVDVLLKGDRGTGGENLADASLRLLPSIQRGRPEDALASAGGVNTSHSGNVSITSANTNEFANMCSSSNSDSKNRLKRCKTTTGYRGISLKENMHVNVRQPFISSNTLVKPDANTLNKPAGNSQIMPDDDKGKGRAEKENLCQRPPKKRMTVHEAAVSRITPVNGSPTIGLKGGRIVRCVEVVRKRSEREALRGHQCSECAAYYTALMQQGIVSEENMEEMLRQCSRHKARWSPPRTPEGFWDLTVRTPEKWE